MEHREIETWRDLKAALETMTDAELDQRAQLYPVEASHDDLPALQPLYLIGEVREMTEEACRSAVDNADHPRQVVLFSDWNMFGEDGAIGEDLETGERIFPQGSGKADLIAEMIARLRHFAETDADIVSWVGSDILAACDLIEELRTKATGEA